MLPLLPGDHPYLKAAEAARAEFVMGERAVKDGNAGRVRVCARRAVGAFIQGMATVCRRDYGTHAMANLRNLEGDELLPAHIRQAAGRLLGGARSILAGEAYSDNPLTDAQAIILYFIESASDKT